MQANGHPSPRSASKRAPAPMPALAKQALSENGISPRPSANGKSSGARKGDSADAWSEEQDVALVQVSLHITVTVHNIMQSSSLCSASQPRVGKEHLICSVDPRQKLAMQALKQYKQDHPERWDRVANAIDGKTKQACRARYKELREVHRAKKP